MLKNIVFCLLLLLGIWVTLQHVPLGIIYNFCLILILDHFYVFEGFDTCNFNIPNSIIDDTPITIELGGGSSECSSEEGKSSSEQTLTVSSADNSFNFSLAIPDLPQKLKVGDKVTIRGAQVNNSTLFTVSAVDEKYFKVEEPVGGDYYLYVGVVIINFDIKSMSSSFAVYDKNLMKKQVSEIDTYNSNNYSYLEEIDSLRETINKANQTIQQEETNITSYKKKQSKNIKQINSNNLTIQNKADLVSYREGALENDAVLDSDYTDTFNQKYKQLGLDNLNLDNDNTNLSYEIVVSKKKIEGAYKTKCQSRARIEKILQKMNKNTQKSLQVNDSVSQQNASFRNFMNSCTVPPAPVINFGPISKTRKEC